MISIRSHEVSREDAPHRIAGITLRRVHRRGPSFAAQVSRTAHPARSGVVLGGTIAFVTWSWVAIVDVALGRPLETFSILGGTALFTVVHVALCLAYGCALAAAVRAASAEPGVILAAIFGTLLLEVAFAMLTVLLSMTALGALAWLRIFVGSLLGTAVAFVMLNHWYPLAELVRHAQEER